MSSFLARCNACRQWTRPGVEHACHPVEVRRRVPLIDHPAQCPNCFSSTRWRVLIVARVHHWECGQCGYSPTYFPPPGEGWTVR